MLRVVCCVLCVVVRIDVCCVVFGCVGCSMLFVVWWRCLVSFFMLLFTVVVCFFV